MQRYEFATLDYNVDKNIRALVRDIYFKVQSTIKPRNDSIIICNSFPKSGTHMLCKILELITNKKVWDDIVSNQSLSGLINTNQHIRNKILSSPKGTIVKTHLPPSPKLFDFYNDKSNKQVMILRDPRDIVVSHANWVRKEPNFYLHKLYNDISFDECIIHSICGIKLNQIESTNIVYPSLNQEMTKWLEWQYFDNCFIVKFEDLVGIRGGGDEQVRLETINSISNYLGYEINSTDSKYSSIKSKPNNSHTFKNGLNGKKGTWREYFNNDITDIFKTECGDLLIKMGYEKDFNW